MENGKWKMENWGAAPGGSDGRNGCGLLLSERGIRGSALCREGRGAVSVGGEEFCAGREEGAGASLQCRGVVEGSYLAGSDDRQSRAGLQRRHDNLCGSGEA